MRRQGHDSLAADDHLFWSSCQLVDDFLSSAGESWDAGTECMRLVAGLVHS